MPGKQWRWRPSRQRGILAGFSLGLYCKTFFSVLDFLNWVIWGIQLRIVTGLIRQDEMSVLASRAGLAGPVPDLPKAQRQLSDMFSKFSKTFTCQFCTQTEWQIQDGQTSMLRGSVYGCFRRGLD